MAVRDTWDILVLVVFHLIIGLAVEGFIVLLLANPDLSPLTHTALETFAIVFASSLVIHLIYRIAKASGGE
jgi:hypothetical protein